MKKVLWILLVAFVVGNGLLLLTMTPEILATEATPALTMPDAHPPAFMTLAAIKAGRMQSLAANAYRGGSLLEMREFNMGGILVRHPEGNLLFDTGFGKDLSKHVAYVPGLMRALSKITPEGTVADQLLAAGIQPVGLKGVILTHGHWDHVSGLPDLAGAPVWITQPELDWIHAGGKGSELVASFKDVNYQTYGFEGGPYLGFEKSHDVFGDGSVVLVPAPGHTPGSIVAFIHTPDGRHYCLIGDIAWQKEGFEIPAQRPLVSRFLVDTDPAANRAWLVKLHGLHEALPSLVIVPAHDRRVWNSLPSL